MQTFIEHRNKFLFETLPNLLGLEFFRDEIWDDNILIVYDTNSSEPSISMNLPSKMDDHIDIIQTFIDDLHIRDDIPDNVLDQLKTEFDRFKTFANKNDFNLN